MYGYELMDRTAQVLDFFFADTAAAATIQRAEG
jgi:hypothetical protein